MLLAALLAVAALPDDLPPRVARLLETGKWDATPRGFRIVALSNVADACAARGASEETRACVKRAYALALSTKPAAIELARPSAEHGLWLSHLALILGASDAVGPCADPVAHAAVAAALAARSTAEPTGIAPSYPGKAERWPADQAATLAALARADRAHGTRVLEAPLARYRVSMAARQSEGLPWSEATGRGRTSKLPRGCALSWTVRYLAEVDLELARAVWAPYRERYLVDRALLVGFREWPPGVERRADADSGPIVRGVGAAATAFALPAARRMGEGVLAARLSATASMVGAVSKGGENVLAEAILDAGRR